MFSQARVCLLHELVLHTGCLQYEENETIILLLDCNKYHNYIIMHIYNNYKMQCN